MPADIYGLILAGGKSSRMKTDKGTLCYHSVPQIEYTFKLLSKYCSKCFVSVKTIQYNQAHLKTFPLIEDSSDRPGPLTGIISAMEKYPSKAWIVLACDLPFVQEKTIEQLTRERDLNKFATCFINPDKNWPEPLCTLYEPRAQSIFRHHLDNDLKCPRKILAKEKINSLIPHDNRVITNVNTPEEYQQAKKVLANHC